MAFTAQEVLCLLSLQAEIIQLEKEFKTERLADIVSASSPAANYCRNFKLSPDASSSQHMKLGAIRALIKEYSQLPEYHTPPLPQ